METFDIAIIGAGAAGLTAAAFAARDGWRVTVVESMTAGGQVSNVDAIDNYPGLPAGTPGYELGPLLQEQAAEAGAEFVLDTVSRVDGDGDGYLLALSEGHLRARCVIVAAGSTKRRLGVPGEGTLWGRGVSQCASCDGPLFRGLRACVVGGGDSALQEALHLSRHASRVTIVHRGASFRAQHALVAKLQQADNIDVRFNTTVEEIMGDASVTGARLRDTATGVDQVLDAEGVFVFIGLMPNTAFLGPLADLDGQGRISVDAHMRTSRPGILAAGDIRSDSAAMLAASAGDGVTAARSATAYLRRRAS